MSINAEQLHPYLLLQLSLRSPVLLWRRITNKSLTHQLNLAGCRLRWIRKCTVYTCFLMTSFLIFDMLPRLEEAFSKALEGFFQSIKPSKSDVRGAFFQLYKRESEEFDKDFIKKYDEDTNTTLIFVRPPNPL
jgi:hypothetical protein